MSEAATCTFHPLQTVNAAAVSPINWEATAAELDPKSPLEIMDHVRNRALRIGLCADGGSIEMACHPACACPPRWMGLRTAPGPTPAPLPVMLLCPQALKTFGGDIGIAFSGAEDVALVEYAHLTGRPYRVFRCAALAAGSRQSQHPPAKAAGVTAGCQRAVAVSSCLGWGAMSTGVWTCGAGSWATTAKSRPLLCQQQNG